MSKVYFGEEGYLELIRSVLVNGKSQEDRTGVGTISIFDAKVVYGAGAFNCFSTVRPTPLRLAFEELWFFLKGESDTKKLEDKGVMFWRSNTSRDFLDSRGLNHLPEGNMGAAYGKQYRNYSDSVDQLVELIDTLSSDPNSRRLMIDLWNPAEHKDMCLTPCWFNFQLVVIDGYLNMKLRNRSLDVLFGYSFAVQQYRLLQLCLCKMFGYKLGQLSVDLSHVHLYNNQIEYAKETIDRNLGKQGSVTINKELNTLDDLLSLQWEDFEIKDLEVNKQPYLMTRPNMAV